MFTLMKKTVALLLLCTPLANAQQPEVVSAYVAGDYMRAVDLAEAANTADDLAFAARAVLAKAISADASNPASEALQLAERLSREALVLDSSHTEAKLQLAISLSLMARPMSLRQARRSGYGEASRDLAEDVLADDPAHHLAHGFLAVWHAEVVRRGGRIGAMIMNASVKDAREHYQMANITDPDNASIHWQWARALASINPKKYEDEINAALNLAAVAELDDALEGVMQSRAAALSALMQAGAFDEAETMAKTLL